MVRASSTTKPVLNISTKPVDRQYIDIDGKLYALRAADEFSFLGYQAEAAKFKALAAVVDKPNLTHRERAIRSRLLRELVDLVVVDAPRVVLNRLKDAHRIDIITVFSLLLRKAAKGAGAKPTTAPAASRTRSKR